MAGCRLRRLQPAIVQRYPPFFEYAGGFPRLRIQRKQAGFGLYTPPAVRGDDLRSD
jgi:hypothetical protein